MSFFHGKRTRVGPTDLYNLYILQPASKFWYYVSSRVKYVWWLTKLYRNLSLTSTLDESTPLIGFKHKLRPFLILNWVGSVFKQLRVRQILRWQRSGSGGSTRLCTIWPEENLIRVDSIVYKWNDDKRIAGSHQRWFLPALVSCEVELIMSH